MKVTAVLLLLAAVLTAGCNTLDRRITEKQGVFNALDAESQARLRAGKVALGDSQDAAYIALGTPDRKRTVENASGRSEVWIYLDSRFEGRGVTEYGYARTLVRDRHGRVVAITYEPIFAESSGHIVSEPVLRLVFREGKLAEIEETKRD